MKKILVLLLVCALVFSLMLSITACRQKNNNNNNNSDNNQGDNNQGDNNQGDNNPDDNPGDNTPDNTPVEPDDDPINNNGTIETPPIPVGFTNNKG